MSDKEHSPSANAGEARPIQYGDLNSRIGYALRRAQMTVFQDFYRAVAPWNLTPAQYSTLVVIQNNPGLSQTQVAEALGIKKANFVSMIKELESRGLARRDSMPGDRRSFALHLGSEGQRVMTELAEASQDHEDRLRRSIGDEQYHAVFAVLHALAGYTYAGDSPPERI